MLILALDSATKVCSTALLRDTTVLAAYDVNVGLTHSEGLMPQLDQLFVRTGIKKTDVDKIAVSIGPGSFTGLRIGLASAEAMAYAWNCAICGVNTLKALTYNLPVEETILAPVLDAQKGNYYLGIYRWNQGRLEELLPVSLVSIRELLEKVSGLEQEVLLLGECDKLAREVLPLGVKLAPDYVRLPRAASVGLAAGNPDCVLGTDLWALKPYYIRRSEAEELWEKKQQAASGK